MTGGWVVTVVSAIVSGGAAGAAVAAWNGWRQRKSDKYIAEGDRTAASTLEWNRSQREILTRVNRLVADADALAENAILPHHNYEPLGELRSFTTQGSPPGEDARTEADSYLISEELGQLVTRLRKCRDNVNWAGSNDPDYFTENGSAPEIVDLRTAAEQVKAQVRAVLATL